MRLRRPPGFFDRRSMIRQVVGERAVGAVYGARASFVGALHPVAMEGTSQSTAARDRPFLRLGHTAAAFNALIFGTQAEAQAQIDRVRSMHDRVRGRLAVDGGPAFPAGTPYSAYDPEASFWTLAVLADSAEVLYERLVRRLDAEERERLWADWRRFGIAFGMPADTAPGSWGEYRERFESLLDPGRLHLTATGRRAGLNVGLKGPMPWPLRPVTDAFYLLVAGTVPRWVRDAYDLTWTPAHAAALTALCAAHRRGRVLVPAPIRRGSPQPLLDLVVREERARVRDGRPVWQPST